MGAWSVTLTYPYTDDVAQLDHWSDVLGDDVAVASIPGNATTIALWVEAAGPVAAIHAATEQVSPVLGSAPLGIEAVVEDRYLATANEPTVPELVSSVEAGEILGVSRQRIAQLAGSHARFPKPLYELRTGPLWTRTAIDWFATNVERRPGRPSSTRLDSPPAQTAQGEDGAPVGQAQRGGATLSSAPKGAIPG